MTTTTNAQLAHYAVAKAWPAAVVTGERVSSIGNKLTDYFDGMTERYPFDFAHCGMKSDWYQYDTTQDASYYGHWCNPVLRAFVSFVEGDILVVECETADDYRREMQAMEDWNDRHDEVDAGACVRLDDHDYKHWQKLNK